MIRIYPEHLYAQLHKRLFTCYLLIGNDPFLLQESLSVIKTCAQKKGFTENLNIMLDNNTNWDMIFRTYQSISLFSRRQMLTLTLPDDGPDTVTAIQLEKLITLLHSDILSIMTSTRLNKIQKNSAWYKAFMAQAVLIPCITPKYTQLLHWVTMRAKSKKLNLDQTACQLLCYYYEGNLLALMQVLERLSLRWPDGKLTLSRVEQAISDAAHFTLSQWVDALLAGKIKRALRILKQLISEKREPVTLLRILQRELILLLTLQRHKSKTPLCVLFDQYGIVQHRRTLISDALQRLSLLQLYQAIQLLTQLEISLKQDYNQQLWLELETLSLLLCNNKALLAS